MKKTEKEKKAPTGEPRRHPYGALKRAAHRVLVWADPAFEYDRLAVTKNFTGSPHVDKDDVTFQYALSLGDFAESGGGELVVESESGDERWVVETRNRVARVDGRFAHWVRGYDTTPRVSVSGDGVRGDAPGTNPRYSVIFYANKPSAATARLHPPADARFAPRGRAGTGTGTGRGKGEARGASLGAVGGTWGSPPGISTALVKCFAAILGIGMVICGRAGGRAPGARGARETVSSRRRERFSTSRQASIGNVWPSVRVLGGDSLMSSSSSSSAVFRASTVGRDCTTRRPPWWRTFSSRVAHARTPRVVSPRASRAGPASHRAPPVTSALPEPLPHPTVRFKGLGCSA